jgi:2-oxoglutarate ferredoxin oxidoreductase subunit beta
MSTFGFHTIHGRAPAVATGVKLANPDLSVWVVTGDGDALSIGGNHLIHLLRRNVDLTVLLFNNRIYGLTKGQYSPTSEFGKKTKSSPLGTIERPIWPVRTALAAQATFVARTLYSDPAHLTRTLEAAARHRGTSFIEILQNCKVFNEGAFEDIVDRSQADELRINIEHGKPIRFGPAGRLGLAVRNLEPKIVNFENTNLAADDTLTHNAEADSPALAELLAALSPPDFPMAFGVFRQVTRPVYEELLMQQVHEATQKRGRGDLARLFKSGTTWEVE